MNCAGTAPAGGCHVQLGDARLRVNTGQLDLRGAAKIVIRPEQVKLVDEGSTDENQMPGMVDRLVYLGPTTQLIVRCPGDIAIQTLVTNADTARTAHPGNAGTRRAAPPDSVRLLPPGPLSVDELSDAL